MFAIGLTGTGTARAVSNWERLVHAEAVPAWPETLGKAMGMFESGPTPKEAADGGTRGSRSSFTF